MKNAAIGMAASPLTSLLWLGSQRVGLQNVKNKLKVPKFVKADGYLMVPAPNVSDLGGGRFSKVWAYTTFPGPSLTARSGDTVSIRLVNKLREETITHWHGVMVDTANDGGPQEVIERGEHYDYQFPLSLPSGKYEIPLLLRDASFDADGNLKYVPDDGGFFGDVPLVNGTLSPTMKVDKGMYRLRILNCANARVFRIGLSNGQQMVLIGNDGGLLTQPVGQSQIVIGPAERLDLLVDFSSLAAGDTVVLKDFSTGWELLEFSGSGFAGYSYSVPPNLSVIAPLDGPSDPTRVFEFMGHNLINGQSFDMDRIDFSVPFGVVERWQFYAVSAGPHPIHVHGASFQVVSRVGGRNQVFPWERGWKDTVLLNSQETVDVLVRFDNYRGRYLLHCHNLEHEDMGMMSNFEVV